MHTTRLFVLLLALTPAGCASNPAELNVAENAALLTKETLAGVNLGDSWEAIKQNHDPKFSVREDTNGNGLPRRILSKREGGMIEGYDGITVELTLDHENRVSAMSFDVEGRKSNRASVRSIQALLIAHFHLKTGKEGCHNTVPVVRPNYTMEPACVWTVPGPKGKRYDIVMDLTEHNDGPAILHGVIESRI